MEEKKDNKGLVFGIIAFIAGIIFIAYGTISLLSAKPESDIDNNDNNQEDVENNDGPSISVTENDVKDFLTNNAKLIEYFTDYNADFDLGEMNPVSISNVFGWSFVFLYNHGEGETLSDSQYAYKYTMPIADADTFMRAYFGIPASIIDVTKIDFSKEVFNFTSDSENYYVEVAETGLNPIQNCVLDNVNIVSDSEIIVVYGVMELDKTCEDKSDTCYTKKRELKMRKSDSGFTILSANDVKEDVNNEDTNNENPDDQTLDNNENDKNI